MKALKIGIIMLLVVAILISCGIFFLYNFTTDFNSVLYEAQKLYNAGSYEEAKQKIEFLTSFLDKYHNFLCVMLDHREVTDAQVSLSKLLVFSVSDEAEYFNAECSSLMLRVENMYSSEKLNLANIF